MPTTSSSGSSQHIRNSGRPIRPKPLIPILVIATIPPDDIILNIRVGIIFKYNDRVLIEIRKDRKGNSVIPGGRMKIDELRKDTVKREIKEEMGLDLVDEKIKYKDIIESFFDFDGKRYHEIFFVYKYDVDEHDYKMLLKAKENLDNHTTEYIFVSYDEFDKVDLLPLEIRDIIKE